MTTWSDNDGVIHRFMSDAEGERLLGGEPPTGDEATARVASLVNALRQPAEHGELAGTEPFIDQLALVARASASSLVATTSRKSTVRRRLTTRAAALAAVGIVGLSAAAAATGNLPGPVEDGLRRIGVDVSSGDDEPEATTSTAATSTVATSTVVTTRVAPDVLGAAENATSATPETPPTPETTTTGPIGPDVTGPAKVGLCTAYRTHGSKNMEATAFRNLLTAATNAGQTVEQFCADVTGPASHGTTPAGTAPGRPADPGKPDAPGKSGTTPAGTAPGTPNDPGKPDAPGKSGTAPAGTAPDTPPGRPDDPGKPGSRSGG